MPVFALVFTDQLAKYLVLTFNITPVILNQGIGFGIFPSLIWSFLSVLVLLSLIFLSFKNLNTGMIFIIAGGLSNLFDRIVRGSIVDFISLPLFPWQFNPADIFITIGAVLVILKKDVKPKHII